MSTIEVTEAPAASNSLHNKVLEQLRNHILSGNLDFGERLAERELCEQFQVSRTPLREALKVLAAEGFVELLPNRGARVRKFTDQEIWETFEYLGGLESLAGHLACERITPEEFSAIEQMHYDMYRHFSRQELKEYFAINLRFHHAIVAAARNSVLYANFRNTSLAMQRLRYSANLDRTRDRWAQAVREHEEMLEALRARNGKELGDIMLKHIRHKSQAVIDWLSRADAESSKVGSGEQKAAD